MLCLKTRNYSISACQGYGREYIPAALFTLPEEDWCNMPQENDVQIVPVPPAVCMALMVVFISVFVVVISVAL